MGGEENMREIGRRPYPAGGQESSQGACGPFIARPDAFGLFGRPAQRWLGVGRRILAAHPEKKHRPAVGRAPFALARQVVGEPRGHRRLPGRPAEAEPNITGRDAGLPEIRKVGEPAHLGKALSQRLKRVGDTASQLHRSPGRREGRQESPEHEIIAQIPGAEEMVPEVNFQ